MRPVGPGSSGRDSRGERRVVAESPDRSGQCVRLRRRHEQRALAVDEQLARRRRVRGDDGRAAGQRLEDLVRDDPSGFVGGAEDPERAVAAAELAGEALVVDPRDPLDVGGAIREQRLELARADDPKGDVRSEPRRREDRLEPVQRDQLSDEQAGERLA